MNIRLRALSRLMLAAVAVAAAPGRATIIDFAPLTNAGTAMSAGNPYIESGYSFTYGRNDPVPLFSWGAIFSAYSADPTGATLNIADTRVATTLSRPDGSKFALLSVDLTDLVNGAYGGPDTDIEFAFTDATGTSFQTVTIDHLAGLQTFNFNRVGLTSVAFSTPSGPSTSLQADNFSVRSGWPAIQVGFTPLADPTRDVNFASFPDYHENGMSFTFDSPSFSWGGVNLVYSADPQGATLISNYDGAITTVARDDGGLFDFVAVDLTSIYNQDFSPGGSVEFAFTDAQGTTYQTVSVDDLAGLETFNFNRSRLLSLSYTSLGRDRYVQADNFLFFRSSVPEPASWALMIAGFGMAGGVLRTRRRQTA